MDTNPQKIIAQLNAIHVGEMAVIRGRIGEAREGCVALERQDLVDKLDLELIE